MNITDKPTLNIKRRNIQILFDYLLDNKLEFSVKDKAFTADEFEISINITEIKKAIAFGVFLRENKLEMPGVYEVSKTTKKASNGKSEEINTPVNTKEEKELVKSEPELENNGLFGAPSNEAQNQVEAENELSLDFSSIQ